MKKAKTTFKIAKALKNHQKQTLHHNPQKFTHVYCILFALSVILTLSGCTLEVVDTASEGVLVERVVDGDTFVLEDGQRVRLIGVDTPESVHPDKSKNTEFGKEASAFAKEALEGKRVILEKDVSDTDRYGRLLRYVYLEDGTFFNEYLVKEGYAKVYTYPPDVKFSDVFVEAERYARENNKGLWALDDEGESDSSGKEKEPPESVEPNENGTTTDKNTGNTNSSPITTNTPNTPNATDNANTSPAPSNGSHEGEIKGNINSKGEKIYHVPGGAYYDRTVAEEWFKTEEEAQAAGYRKSSR